MDNNDSLRTLLINIRNNQELYMQHQWKVSHFSFLLYVAIIWAFRLIGTYKCLFLLLIVFTALLSIFFLIWKLERSIRENQQMAEEIYDSLSPLRRIVGRRSPPKRLTIGIMLSIIVGIGMLTSIIVLCSIRPTINKEIVQRIDKLDQKINQYVNTLEEIKIENKVYDSINQRINAINKQLSQRIDQLEEKIDMMEAKIQVPQDVRSKEK